MRTGRLILQGFLIAAIFLSGCSQPAPSSEPAPVDTLVPTHVETASPLGGGTPLALATLTPAGEISPAAPTPPATPTPAPVAAPTLLSSPEPALPPVRFAVIGDYGLYNEAQTAIATLIAAWQVDFIVTTGDNNYDYGEAATIDVNIGQNFHEYLGNYQGVYGQGAAANRFFPVLGNHDYLTPGAQPYLDYFTLPGNERYYTFTWGVVDFFMLNSDPNEPDGFRADSTQAGWLQTALDTSSGPWKVVVLHAAPFTSGAVQGSTGWSQWPYEEWGADAVLAGHEHVYERLQIGGIPYFVNGLGGRAIYSFGVPLEASRFRYNDGYGAMLVSATAGEITYEFWNVDGQPIDSLTIQR